MFMTGLITTKLGTQCNTRFDPNKHDVIPNPHDAEIAPLDYCACEDREFEEEEEEVTECDAKR